MHADGQTPPRSETSPRAVWNAAGLLLAMTFPALATWLSFVALAGHSSMPVVYTVSKVVQFGFPVAWMLVVQRQRVRLPMGLRGLGWGAGFGLVVAAGLVTLYAVYLKTSDYLADAPAQLRVKLADLGTPTPLAFIGLAAFYTLGHSFLEEYYWRWFVHGQLQRWVPWQLAVVLSSAGFAAHHVIVVSSYVKSEHFWTATLFFSACVAVGGAVWAWLLDRNHSLAGPWLSHALVDAALMIVGFDLVWGLIPA